MKNKKIDAKIAGLKKTLKDFVADEDGFVSKETMLKVGLSTVAGIGVLGVMSDVHAQNVTTHTNTMTFSTGTGPGGCLVPEDATHTNVGPTHSSY